ncbi:MAG TPA: MFS transporter, partial [Humisphaera sp.]|nr:MFS transporter [Humisphaera sp.]
KNPEAGDAAEKLLSSPGFWILLLINVLVGIVNWAVYGWMPTFFREQFHLGVGAAGLSATGYIQIASFGGVLFAGLLADQLSLTWRGARALVPAVGFALAGPCLFGSALTGTFPVAVSCLVIFGIGRGAFDANHMPLLREIVDERYSASGYGLLNFVSTAAGGIMVYAGGALRDAQVPLGAIFQVAGVALFIAGMLLLVIRLSMKRVSNRAQD